MGGVPVVAGAARDHGPGERSVRGGKSLAAFVGALQRIDASGGPAAGPGNGRRGVPLADRDAVTREAVRAVALADYRGTGTALEATAVHTIAQVKADLD
ncbi:hypothetical protein [Nonomuraea endophytica]|uniref:hypothetical protein n=1 Tax=Nonomuraea endophytica TaxID=714136 RepID=UPI0037CB339E